MSQAKAICRLLRCRVTVKITSSRRIKHTAYAIQTPSLALHCSAEDTQTFTAREGISAEPSDLRDSLCTFSAGGLLGGLCV